MLKALIFNLDKVIVDLSNYHFLAWKMAFNTHDIKISKRDWHFFETLPQFEKVIRILMFYKKHLSDDNIQKLLIDKKQFFLEIVENQLTKADLMFDINQLIIDAKRKNLKLAVASFSRESAVILKKLKLFNKFDYVMDYADKSICKLTEFEKSAIIPAKFVMTKIQVLSSECIVFESNLKTLQTLNDLKIYSVGIAYGVSMIKQIASFWVDSPNEIQLDPIVFDYYKND